MPVGKLAKPFGGIVEQTLGGAEVGSKTPSMGEVADPARELSHLRRVGVAMREGGQHQDGVAVASWRRRYQVVHLALGWWVDQRDGLGCAELEAGAA